MTAAGHYGLWVQAAFNTEYGQEHHHSFINTKYFLQIDSTFHKFLTSTSSTVINHKSL